MNPKSQWKKSRNGFLREFHTNAINHLIDRSKTSLPYLVCKAKPCSGESQFLVSVNFDIVKFWNIWWNKPWSTFWRYLSTNKSINWINQNLGHTVYLYLFQQILWLRKTWYFWKDESNKSWESNSGAPIDESNLAVIAVKDWIFSSYKLLYETYNISNYSQYANQSQT